MKMLEIYENLKKFNHLISRFNIQIKIFSISLASTYSSSSFNLTNLHNNLNRNATYRFAQNLWRMKEQQSTCAITRRWMMHLPNTAIRRMKQPNLFVELLLDFTEKSHRCCFMTYVAVNDKFIYYRWKYCNDLTDVRSSRSWWGLRLPDWFFSWADCITTTARRGSDRSIYSNVTYME